MVKRSISVWQWQPITEVLEHDHRGGWGDCIRHYQQV
jgi:hypothetical protein